MIFTDSIIIRGELARVIKDEARAAHKAPADLLRDWVKKLASLEDQSDIKAADASERLSRGQAHVSADDLFKQCGI